MGDYREQVASTEEEASSGPKRMDFSSFVLSKNDASSPFLEMPSFV